LTTEVAFAVSVKVLGSRTSCGSTTMDSGRRAQGTVTVSELSPSRTDWLEPPSTDMP
jgi:hypothetical protein